MARSTRDQIDTFIRITGASEPLAVRKLEEYGGNLDAAVNAHFAELEGSFRNSVSAIQPRYDFVDTSNRAPVGSRNLFPLLSAARSFRPSLLLDPHYRRSVMDQISSSFFPTYEPGYSPVRPFHVGYGQPYLPGTRPIYQDPCGTPLSHGPQIHGNVSSDGVSHLHDSNAEEEIIQRAIEASRQEALSGTGLAQRQLHLEDDELARALSLSLKTAEQEQAAHNQRLEDHKQQPGVRASNASAEKTKTDQQKPETSSLQDGAEDMQEQSLWGAISLEELDKAILLEAALFGEMPEGASSQHRPHLQSDPERSIAFNSQHSPRPPSPSLVAQRLLREQQDNEYVASLLADREKEASATKEAETSCLREGGAEDNMLEAEKLRRLLAAKVAALPHEPTIDDVNAVTLLVRMPDGSRYGRRFLKSDKLQSIFDFIDAGGVVKPGTYRVVRPYPRCTFSLGNGTLSLNELGLTNKQEALYLELL